MEGKQRGQVEGVGASRGGETGREGTSFTSGLLLAFTATSCSNGGRCV